MFNKGIFRKSSNKFAGWLFILGGLILAVILVFGLFLFTPLNTRSLVSKPHPAQDYAESLQMIDQLQNRELPGMNPKCLPRILNHGKTVKHVIVFIHGYTNCPQQFATLGDTFYELGYNVLVLPLPHHGLADRMTTEQEQMTAEELVSYADTAVDISQGLGEHVTLVGFSAGGTIASWAAQTRKDIDFAVLIAPAFGYLTIPTPLTLPATRLALALPNIYQWWDPVQKEKDGINHTYPRFATHALAQILRLGFAVRTKAHQTAPDADSILVVTNGNERDVNNALTDEIVRDWIAHGAEINRYEFRKELGLDHDFIDPDQPDEQIDIVYPELIRLIKR